MNTFCSFLDQRSESDLYKEAMIIWAGEVDDSVGAAVVFAQRPAKLEPDPSGRVVLHFSMKAHHAGA